MKVLTSLERGGVGVSDNFVGWFDLVESVRLVLLIWVRTIRRAHLMGWG